MLFIYILKLRIQHTINVVQYPNSFLNDNPGFNGTDILLRNDNLYLIGTDILLGSYNSGLNGTDGRPPGPPRPPYIYIIASVLFRFMSTRLMTLFVNRVTGP